VIAPQRYYLPIKFSKSGQKISAECPPKEGASAKPKGGYSHEKEKGCEEKKNFSGQEDLFSQARKSRFI